MGWCKSLYVLELEVEKQLEIVLLKCYRRQLFAHPCQNFMRKWKIAFVQRNKEQIQQHGWHAQKQLWNNRLDCFSKVGLVPFKYQYLTREYIVRYINVPLRCYLIHWFFQIVAQYQLIFLLLGLTRPRKTKPNLWPSWMPLRKTS